MDGTTEDSEFPDWVWRVVPGYGSVVQVTPVPDHLWDGGFGLVLFDTTSCHDFRGLIIAFHSPGDTMGGDVTSRGSQKRRMSPGLGPEDSRTSKRRRVASQDGDRPHDMNITYSRPTELGGYPSRLDRQPVSLYCSALGPY